MADQSELEVTLYGPFQARWSDGVEVEIKSAKLRGLIAMLAMGGDARRSRSHIQDVLWGRSGPEHGRASLRQALSALRTLLGDRFTEIFDVTKDGVRLQPGSVTVIGGPRDGLFLEGIDIKEDGFEDWLRTQRSAADSAPGERPPGRVQPIVVVTPFLVLGGEGPQDAVLGDVISQEVTRALSRMQLLSVISHLSSRTIDPSIITLPSLRETLDCDYVTAGSLRRLGGKVAIDVDFVDGHTGRVFWSRSFTEEERALLESGSETIRSIAMQVAQTILAASVTVAGSRPLGDVESHALMMSAIGLMHQMKLAGFARARSHLEEVVAREPGHAVPLAWLGEWYVLSIAQGWSVDKAQDTAKAENCLARALDLDPFDPLALTIDGNVQTMLQNRLDIAKDRFTEALALDPNNSLAWLSKGALSAFRGEGTLAVECAGHARRLSPLDPRRDFFDSLTATAHLANQDYEMALELADRSLEANPRHVSTMRVRTIALELMGRHAEAVAAAETLRRHDREFTVSGYLAVHPAASYRTGTDWANALRRAGIPER
ncbi:MAG: tetratricopeptide repeat protein [Pseudomonadota bacterium]